MSDWKVDEKWLRDHDAKILRDAADRLIAKLHELSCADDILFPSYFYEPLKSVITMEPEKIDDDIVAAIKGEEEK